MQQQMLNPSSGGSSATSGSAGSTTPSTGQSASFASALASAQGMSAPDASTLASAEGIPSADASAVPGLPGATGASALPGALGATAVPGALGTTAVPGALGTTGMPGALGATGIPAATSADPRVQAMVEQANALVGKPYVYGGGHSGWSPSSGYDCSGFVSKVLHAGGYLSQPVDTTALPSQPGMVAGPGQYVTVYDRALPGQSGHVIIQINGQFYESGGSAGTWGGGGGVQAIGVPSAAYLANFPNVLHPAGL